MKVYLVILEDRHTDVEVEVYADQQAALDRAAEIVEEYGYVDEEPYLVPEWLFNANLSGEGDAVSVQEKEVDAAEPPG